MTVQILVSKPLRHTKLTLSLYQTLLKKMAEKDFEHFPTLLQPVRKVRRPTIPRSTIFLGPLFAFLLAYNFVPSVHHKVQSFFSLERWHIDTQPEVTTSQGTFIGTVLESSNHPVPVEAFLGIRYAEPPVGERRFRRAVPLPDSNETIQATEYSFRCPGKQLLRIPGTPWLEPSEV